MFAPSNPSQPWSRIGLRALIGSIIAAVLLSILDGVVKGPLQGTEFLTSDDGRRTTVMVLTWIVDFRYLSEQAVYAATIFFVGAKFFETRTVFTIGFDKLDAAKISIKGPDENNVVWIGHRYGTKMEAATVAEAFAERLKESAA